MNVVLSAQAVVAPDGSLVAPGHVEITDGRVTRVCPGPAPSRATCVDAGNVILAPSFVDLQVNGLGDVDLATADDDGWGRARRRLLAAGVTGFLATLVSGPRADYARPLARAAEAVACGTRATTAGTPGPPRPSAGARVLGVHLEGPFLGGAPGAHPPHLLGPVDVPWLTGLLDAHPGLVRMVTLAPEADPGWTGTRLLAARGILVALGHSRCSYADAVHAAHAGARAVTHLFNGMAPLHHREPGLAGAALSDPRLTPTVIADFVHVHPAMVAVACRAGDAALVSDAVATGGDYFGHRVVERDGAAYLDDGTLTGSTLTLDVAVRNVASLVGVEQALGLAGRVPGRLLGLDTYGAIGLGGRADLVALDADTLSVTDVWLEGEQVLG